MASAAQRDLARLKESFLDDSLHLDLSEYRETSRSLKEVLTTSTNGIISDVTKVKEEALAVEEKLSAKQELVNRSRADADALEEQAQAVRNDTKGSRQNMDRKRALMNRIQGDLKMYEESLAKAKKHNRKPALPIENGAAYLMFLTVRAEATVQLQKIVTRCSALQQLDPKSWWDSKSGSSKELSTLLAECTEFEATVERIRAQDMSTLRQLKRNLSRGSFFGGDVHIDKVEAKLNEATEALADWQRKLVTEEERRLNYDSGVDEFMKEQRMLIEWCRTQKSTLSQLPSTENVQEFCASLQGRIPHMEKNLAVLTDMGEELIPGPQQSLVEKTLVDVNKVWIDLQIFSYEKLRNALLEEHASSSLKEEAQQFATWATENVKGFLDSVEELMKLPDEQESQAQVRPVLDMCKVLQNDFGPHQLICEHISDFDVRMEVINDHYKYLLKTITSPLTYMCQKLNAFNTRYHRKDEYEEKWRDLHDWVDVMNPTAWSTLHSKVSDVEQLVQAELERDNYRP